MQTLVLALDSGMCSCVRLGYWEKFHVLGPNSSVIYPIHVRVQKAHYSYEYLR